MTYEKRTTLEIDEKTGEADFFPEGKAGGTMFVVSPDGNRKWFNWLMASESKSFRVVSPGGTFTARKEQRDNIAYWYGFKKINRKTRSVYIGESLATTPRELELVARYFESQKRYLKSKENGSTINSS